MKRRRQSSFPKVNPLQFYNRFNKKRNRLANDIRARRSSEFDRMLSGQKRTHDLCSTILEARTNARERFIGKDAVCIYCRRKAVITVTNERFVALGSPTLDFNRSCRHISRGHWLIMPSNFRLDHQQAGRSRHVRVFEQCTHNLHAQPSRERVFFPLDLFGALLPRLMISYDSWIFRGFFIAYIN